jgi:hypothetical protein
LGTAGKGAVCADDPATQEVQNVCQKGDALM